MALSSEEPNHEEPLPKRRLVLHVNVRELVTDLAAQAVGARAQLMAAWKISRATERERDQLRSNLQNAQRRMERAEALSSSAMDWHDEQADQNASAM
eukprot:3102958-Pleurochrysis_carterae.AAC.1